ncbi:MAG: 23S rRNA (guanosine(2251)-2'-O)-methyltransferase RlmB [Clostridiales Family XIII bacterium]|jgi:23S rRNA (guanosine2251-2'-O)-methyltransferase|nr:23S rRNA (guanosine(2251)-2'-O)-methyltransferase RlmB [Clostridiales Family XIII bacterium]
MDAKNENVGRRLVYGRNPVLEALASGADIDRVLIQKGVEGAGRKIYALAKKAGVPVTTLEKNALGREAGTNAHQGVACYLSEFAYATVDDILAAAAALGEAPFIVLLDGIEDPHNLGTIIRSADGAGVHGVVIRKNRAAQVTPAAVKASAGAALRLPVARAANIAQTIDYLKERGVWVYGADTGGENYASLTYEGAAALVVGSEGAGLSRLVREQCDHIVSIPMRGKLASLNASCAAAVVLYEMTKDRA